MRAVGNQRLAAALANDLAIGEAEAIALATEIQADVILMDEKEGRSFARQAGLMFEESWAFCSGLKPLGKVASIRVEIQALRNSARFFVAPALEAEILRSAGE